ncbi:Inositol 2-dehydrogenase [Pirellulimonas nuda]|uniref:Inositol 2-dehydrogenase n=1 Tax=Pirellulimonas nuda TaxID=2528009 RepID=A0A518D621_9BACT|nr:Gfo/Idh/MocA family oxidoreductase [Pirellulimonas nuda]QDU86917.1 Inositol 2-dehydrogenase [Pirellulimonas nuda]
MDPSAPIDHVSRRRFLGAASATAGLAGMGLAAMAAPAGAQPAGSRQSGAKRPGPNDQVVAGFIGCGIRFHELINGATQFGPAAVVCDLDDVQLGRGLQSAMDAHNTHRYPMGIEHCRDYRRVLDRSDLDVVVIATPDHWHTKLAIEAMRAGKDVYCEKPLTLTIAEGAAIEKVLGETGRVFQVGTQQRSDFGKRFANAAAIVRDGRVGKVNHVTCGIDGSMTCPPLPTTDAPREFDFQTWLGQTPVVPYCAGAKIQTSGYGAGVPFSRTHNFFRWWYEYAGGKLTDWGAHHVDIALWATQPPLDKPFTLDPLMVEHPVPFENGMPTVHDRFNCATKFKCRVTFADGLVLDVCDEAPDLGFGNGIMFQGSEGRMFVNRGKLTGKAVDQLKEKPLPEDALEKLYGKKPPTSHMGDFVECVKNGGKTVSDVTSHNAHLNVCHAVNIALRLNRKLTFDPAAMKFTGDDQATSFVARKQRKGFEIGA